MTSDYSTERINELWTRFQLSGDIVVLHEAIDLLRVALKGAPPDRPLRVSLMSNLAAALWALFEQTGDGPVLDESIGLLRAALGSVSSEHPLRVPLMSNLAAAVQARFRQTGEPAAQEESIGLFRAALGDASSEHPEHPLRVSLMSNLAAVLQARFEQTGDAGSLQESVDLLRAALVTVSPEQPIGANLHNNLGVALLNLYVEGGESGYLNEAVDAARRAVGLSTPDQPQVAGYLSNLGAILRTRYDRSGELDDLNEAVDAARRAVAVSTPDHPEAARYLSNLGAALRARYERGGDPRDLDEAIKAAEQAFSNEVGWQPGKALMQFNLGAALRNRFESLGDVADLDKAIGLQREAIAGTSIGDPKRGDYLLDLGGSLQARFLARGDSSDLQEALDAVTDAIEETPHNHPRVAAYLASLGDLLFVRYSRDSNIDDADSAIAMWQRASTTQAAGVSIRLRAARSWASAAAALGRWDSAANGYAEAVNLLPLLVWRGIDRADRAWLLSQWAGVASDAAACMLNAGMPERALETVEHGRGILWSELLEAETELTSLRRTRPDLASLLTRIRNEIDDIGSTAVNAGDIRRSDGDHSLSHVRERRLMLSQEWDRLVDEVRSLPGFESFMHRPRLEQLIPAAAGGPVVIVNVSQWRCDALIVTAAGVQVVRLPHLTLSGIVGRVNECMDALSPLRDDGAEISGFVRRERTITESLEWLWNTVAEPVTSALGYTDSPATGSAWPRVWWCPTGPLALLPLHAASVAQDGTALGLLDRVISSYTPTLRALLRAQPKDVSKGNRDLSRSRLLIVSMPATPGLPSLPGARRERDRVSALVNQGQLLLLEGKSATRAAVLRALKECPWVHIICHGGVDLDEPAQSGLLLYDGRLTVADIARSHDLLDGQFAFLSASDAGLGAVALPDEAVSLASAFHHAGWRHVIAPLWQVRDDVATDIAADVYLSIVEDGQVNASRAPTALHHALRKLRKVYPQLPSAWASYVHSGP